MIKVILACSLLFIAGDQYAAKLTTLADIYKPAHMAVDKNKLYISDQSSVLVYSMDDFKLERKIGGKGEGPGEYRRPPWIKILPDKVLLYTSHKFSIFTKNGELVKEKKIASNMLANIHPVGDNYIINILVVNATGQLTREISIVDNDLNKIHSLYSRLKKPEHLGGKRVIRFINPIVSFQCLGDKILLANSYNGFYIEIFDLAGNSIGTIKRSFKRIKVPGSYKEKREKDFLKKYSISQREKIAKMFKFEYAEYFPPMQKFVISGDRLYIKTYRTKNSNVEYIILDTGGNYLNKVFLPEAQGNPQVFYGNKFYFLKDNEEKEAWELHCLDIL